MGLVSIRRRLFDLDSDHGRRQDPRQRLIVGRFEIRDFVEKSSEGGPEIHRSRNKIDPYSSNSQHLLRRQQQCLCCLHFGISDRWA